MMFVPRRGSLRRTCIPLVYAEMPSGQQVMVAPRPWVGTTPWYHPTANEDIESVSKVGCMKHSVQRTHRKTGDLVGGQEIIH